MRLLLSLALGFVLGAGAAEAKAPYGLAGCGLGSLVIKDDGFMQVFAATTNGTSASQSFGITTGTSNCKPAEEMAVLKQQEDFIAANLTTLYRDMAQGSGETLEAFASVLGCTGTALPTFQNQAQRSHSKIFAAPGAYAVLESAKDEFRTNPVLKNNCNWLI